MLLNILRHGTVTAAANVCAERNSCGVITDEQNHFSDRKNSTGKEAYVMLMETERLSFRKLTQEDFDALCRILQDSEVMYAYEGSFSDEEVQDWLDRQLQRYDKWKFGLWAVIHKETGELIGQCGLTMQPWKEEEVLEIGYLFRRDYWHQGYATEAAQACKKYAFEILNAKEVCSIIRDTNIASQNVAIRNGMKLRDKWTKHYRNVDMLHYRYVVDCE